MSMKTLSAASLAATVLLTSTAFADRLEDDAKRYMHLTDVVVQDIELPDQLVPTLIDVELDGLPFSLDIRPQSIRTAEYALYMDTGGGNLMLEDPGDPLTFRGEVLEDPGSLVAGSLLPEGLYAKIMLTNGEMYWIEPLVGKVPNAPFGKHAVYHQDDVISSNGFCGTDTSGHIGTKPTDGDAAPAAGGQLEIVELGLDADFQYYNQHNANVKQTSARMELVINTMNTQYETEVGLTHALSIVIVRTVSGSPYTSTNPSTLLGQFRTEWNTKQSGQRRDVAHLFTGKNLDGNVIGVAFLGVICTNSAYGLVQSECCGSLACSTDLSAHELGHNWNAGHCSCSGPNYTMNPSLTCVNRFHNNFTEPDIIQHRDSRSCLDDGTILYSDDFESGNFTAGGWTTSSNARCLVKKLSAYSGLNGAKLKKGGVGTGACTLGTDETWIHTPSINTIGCNAVQLQMHAHFRKNDLNCEFMDVQYSVNGGGWISFNSVEKHSWDYYRMNLPANAAGQSDVRIRFVTNAKGKANRAEVDNIRVIGF